MASRRSDFPLAALALAAVALVLAAPLVGRAGFPLVADLVVSLAAASGLCAFLVAAAHSLLHLRMEQPSARPAPSRKDSC